MALYVHAHFDDLDLDARSTKAKNQHCMLSATKQAIRIKLATTVGHFLHDLDFTNVYMACPACYTWSRNTVLPTARGLLISAETKIIKQQVKVCLTIYNTFNRHNSLYHQSNSDLLFRAKYCQPKVTDTKHWHPIQRKCQLRICIHLKNTNTILIHSSQHIPCVEYRL